MTDATKQFVRANLGMADRDIRSALEDQPPVTVKEIPLGDLEGLLRETGLMRRLVALSESDVTPESVRLSLVEILESFQSHHVENLRSERELLAVQVDTTIRALIDMDQLSAEERDAIYALGGGLMWSVPSLEEIAAERVRAEQVGELQAMHDGLDQVAGEKTHALRLAIERIERGEEADAPTAQDIIDAVTAAVGGGE